MAMRLMIALLWCLHLLPARCVDVLATLLAPLLVRLSAARTARINLRLCFPDLDATAHRQAEIAYCRAVLRSLLELGTVWFAPNATLRRRVMLEGTEHLDACGSQPVILLAMHTVGLEMAGARLAMEYRGVGFFTPHKNAFLDGIIRRARDRRGDIRMLDRREGLRPMVRAIRDGRYLYFLPDQDFGDRDAIFVPFFGIAAATVTTLPRLVRLTGARVVPVEVWQTPLGGYRIRFLPAWNDFPSDDLSADVRRMNVFVEQFVRDHPDQYFWGHKRFRTRPDPAEPSPYDHNKVFETAQSALTRVE